MNRLNLTRLTVVAGLLCGSRLLPGGAALSVGQITPPASKHPTPAIAAPATQPTVDMVQTAIDNKDYPGAVKIAARLLSLKGAAAAGISRFQVTMLKGDAQAGMKSISTAVSTYKSATKETTDLREAALARWTAELFHTAGSHTYVPKLIAVGMPKRGPFDLLVSDQRKEAFGVLLEDNLANLDPKLKSATVSQSLPQIWPVLQQVVDLDELDVIANGSDEKTAAAAKSLLDHSRNLLSNALKGYWARLGDIDAHANITTTTSNQVLLNNSMVAQSVTTKNGLTEANKSELTNMITMSQKIRDAAGVFMSVAKSDQGWSTIQTDSDRVAGKASDVLNADYGLPVVSSSNIDSTGGYGIPPGNQFGTGGGATATATATTQGSSVNAQNVTPTPPVKRSNGPSRGKTK